MSIFNINTNEVVRKLSCINFDPSLTRKQKIENLIPGNLCYTVYIHKRSSIDDICLYRMPHYLVDSYDIHGCYRYEDVAYAFTTLLNTITTTPWSELCEDETIIEKAAWFFSHDVLSDIVALHISTPVDDAPFDNVFKLCRLVVTSFAHDSYSLMAGNPKTKRPHIAYNALCVYAACLILSGRIDFARILMEHVRDVYDKEQTEPHSGIVFLYRTLSRCDTNVEMRDAITNAITKIRNDLTCDDERFNQYMQEALER